MAKKAKLSAKRQRNIARRRAAKREAEEAVKQAEKVLNVEKTLKEAEERIAKAADVETPKKSTKYSYEPEPVDSKLAAVLEEEGELDNVDVVETDRSTCLSEVEYSPDGKFLMVTFRESGKTYPYWDISRKTFESLVEADSVGQYYNSEIKIGSK